MGLRIRQLPFVTHAPPASSFPPFTLYLFLVPISRSSTEADLMNVINVVSWVGLNTLRQVSVISKKNLKRELRNVKKNLIIKYALLFIFIIIIIQIQTDVDREQSLVYF